MWLDRSEPLGKPEEIAGRDRLTAQYNHKMVVKRLLDLAKKRVADRGRQVDTFDLGPECAGAGAHLDLRVGW